MGSSFSRMKFSVLITHCSNGYMFGDKEKSKVGKNPTLIKKTLSIKSFKHYFFLYLLLSDRQCLCFFSCCCNDILWQSNLGGSGFILVDGSMFKVQFIWGEIQIMKSLKQLTHDINFQETERWIHTIQLSFLTSVDLDHSQEKVPPTTGALLIKINAIDVTAICMPRNPSPRLF